MEFFDTHSHLNNSTLTSRLDLVLANAKEANVVQMAVIGYDWPSSLFSVHLAEKHDNLVAVVGLHPHDAAAFDDGLYKKFLQLGREPVVKAIGEIGLDYYRDYAPRLVQKAAFERQIFLAKELALPIIIHDRDAHADIMDIVKATNAGENSGIMHCYSGSWEMAKEFLTLGFYISIAGPVTYGNARALPEVAAKVPLDRLLIETDCPYLTPHPHRGKTNEPAFVPLVAAKIAEIRGMALAEIAAITTQNARQFFGLK